MTQVLLDVKEGWLADTMLYSSGQVETTFYKDNPGGVEVFDATEGEHRPGTVRRILYIEVAP